MLPVDFLRRRDIASGSHKDRPNMDALFFQRPNGLGGVLHCGAFGVVTAQGMVLAGGNPAAVAGGRVGEDQQKPLLIRQGGWQGGSRSQGQSVPVPAGGKVAENLPAFFAVVLEPPQNRVAPQAAVGEHPTSTPQFARLSARMTPWAASSSWQ